MEHVLEHIDGKYFLKDPQGYVTGGKADVVDVLKPVLSASSVAHGMHFNLQPTRCNVESVRLLTDFYKARRAAGIVAHIGQQVYFIADGIEPRRYTSYADFVDAIEGRQQASLVAKEPSGQDKDIEVYRFLEKYGSFLEERRVDYPPIISLQLAANERAGLEGLLHNIAHHER